MAAAAAADSLFGWLGGGLLSKTGLKSSRPEREMLAKSSSAEPSLASSSPSKSSSRSSKAPLGAAVAVAGRLPVPAGAPDEPKISSTLDLLRLLRSVWDAAAGTGLSLREICQFQLVILKLGLKKQNHNKKRTQVA